MAKPQYFSYLPNLEYTVALDKAGNQTRLDIKDYFHLLKVREDIFKEETIYEPYFVKNGARPEQVSYDVYGDERYYWVILQANDIVDYYNEWPLSSYELDEYIKDKYGFPQSEDVHHWETREVKDLEGNIFLPSGLHVSEDYVFTYPDIPGSTNFLTSRPVSVSYRQYEYDLNLKKSQINIVKRDQIIRYEAEVRNYGKAIKRDIDPVSRYDVR